MMIGIALSLAAVPMLGGSGAGLVGVWILRDTTVVSAPVAPPPFTVSGTTITGVAA